MIILKKSIIIFTFFHFFYYDNKIMVEIDGKALVSRIDKKLEEKGTNPKRTKRKSLSELGMNPSNLSHWIKGQEPSSFALARIADFLGVSLEWLLFGKEEQQDELTREERELVEAYRHLSTQGKVVVSFIAKGLRQD